MRVFVYSCLFLVIFAFISSVKSREFTCGCCKEKNDHYKSTCPYKDNCPSNNQNSVRKREFTCRCCGEKNDHYKSTCPHKDNCPLDEAEGYNEEDEPTVSSRTCYFEIKIEKN